MGMLESHKMVKRKPKGKDQDSEKAAFFSDQKDPKRRHAGDTKATGSP